MKKPLLVRYLLLTLVLGLFAIVQASAQMKIGNHPTTIHPASILELESNNQALRLTQGDTIDVNTVIGSDTHTDKYVAAEGMILYQNKDSSVYMRTQGHWHKVVSSSDVDSTFWNLKGNMGTDSASSFLGTLDQKPLNIGAGGNKYIIIHSDGTINILGDSLSVAHNASFQKSVNITDSLNVNNGMFKVADSVYIGKPLAIHDSIVIKGLENALSSDSSVLILGSDGVVRKRSLDSIGIRAINGVSGTYLHLKFDTSTAGGHTGPWIDSMTSKGLSTLILNIPNASSTVRGLVSDTTQAFAGNKSFLNSVAIGTTDTATSTLEVNGSVGLATYVQASGTTFDMTSLTNAKYRTLIFDVTSITGGVTLTLPDATKMNGRIYTIKKIGNPSDAQLGNPVKINTTSGETIDGDGTNYTIYNNFSSVTLQAQSGAWYIVGH